MPPQTFKILVIAPTPFFADRGCHTHIAEQILALQRQNNQVLLVTYGIGREFPGVKTRRTFNFPLYRQESIGPSWHKFYVDVFLLLTALKAAWQYCPDVIHAHLHEGCLIGWLVSRVFAVPLLFDCQGSLTGELLAHKFILVRPRLTRRLWYYLEKKIDHLPDRILAQSTEMRCELINRFQVNPHHITMAFDGVNTQSFQPRRKDKRLLQRLKLPPHQPIIVYLGGLTPHKGVDTLLQAFSLVLKKHPSVYLLLMGYPNEKKYLRLAQQHGISSQTRVTGRVRYEDAPRYLALGNIAVAPKRTQTEANGKIYNYMAAGLPTVAFDTVVNRDILGKLGVYSKPAKDYQGLADTISSLLRNHEQRHYLARKVRQVAVAKYSWDQVAQRIMSAYQQVQIPWQIKVFNVSLRKQVKWDWLKPQLKAVIKPTFSCLDVGSGSGILSYLQEQLGGTWTFTETDPAAASQTATLVAGQVYQHDIYHPHLQPKHYDIITVLDVIEHVPDPDRFMRRISALLKPDGQVFITTPADNGRLYLVRYLADKIFNINQDAHGHVTAGFSTSQLNLICQHSGLSISHHARFSKFFTEIIELAYNAAYRAKNKASPSTHGYNLTLSPSSPNDLARHQNLLPLLKIIHPVLRAISRLDFILPPRRGYEWGLVATKTALNKQPTTNSTT